MKHNVMLTVASLLSILFVTFHLTSDTVHAKVGTPEAGGSTLVAALTRFGRWPTLNLPKTSGAPSFAYFAKGGRPRASTGLVRVPISICALSPSHSLSDQGIEDYGKFPIAVESPLAPKLILVIRSQTAALTRFAENGRRLLHNLIWDISAGDRFRPRIGMEIRYPLPPSYIFISTGNLADN